jgi:hypothetical protein
VGVGSGSDGSRGLGARGGGAGHRRRVPVAARGSGSPDFANSGAPVVKTSGASVYHDQHDTHDPPGSLAGLRNARGHGCDGRGGSVWWRSPVCARACCSGHRSGHKRGRARARCKGRPKQGDVAAVQSCRGHAPMERRWQNASACGQATRVGYSLPDLAQQDGEGAWCSLRARSSQKNSAG